MTYKVGDLVTFKWRGSGQPYKATTEVGVVSEVHYVAGVNPETGVGRGYQDRLSIKFLYDHPYPSPGWIYTLYAKPLRRF